MRKLDNFTNRLDIPKTLKFRAIPAEKTQKYLEERGIVNEDREKAKTISEVNNIISRYHKNFINEILSNIQLDFSEYAALFEIEKRTDEENDRMTEIEESLRCQIADKFAEREEFKALFTSSVLDLILPICTEEEVKEVQSLKGFYTALSKSQDTKKRLYDAEPKSNKIGYRIVNENLPRFLMNMRTFNKIAHIFSSEELSEIQKKVLKDQYYVNDLFGSVDAYNLCLCQSGIDTYNSVISGIFTSANEKIKGLNEYINLYNQANQTKLPKFIPLFKQVLSDKEALSFYNAKAFTSDEEMYATIRSSIGKNTEWRAALNQLENMMEQLSSYDLTKIYVRNTVAIKNISNIATGSWNTIADAWNEKYDMYNMIKKPKDMEKYAETRKKAFKKIESFSLSELNELVPDDTNLVAALKSHIIALHKNIEAAYGQAEILSEDYKPIKKIQKDTKAIGIIKTLFDSIKEYELFLKPFLGTGKEDGREEFYSDFCILMEKIAGFDELYDRVRNHITKKPFSTSKFKLYFGNPNLFAGWDNNKESTYRTTLLEKCGKYYIAVMDKKHSKCLQGLSADINGDNYNKLNYKLLTGASKMLPHIFFLKNDMKKYGASDEVISIYKEKRYVKGDSFSLEDCHKLINYYKDALTKYYADKFNFSFKDTEDYADIKQFFDDVDNQGYNISFDKISAEQVDGLVDEGKVYLFQIYCMDFSEKSHGTENLHTIYFRMLFDEQNKGIIRLCGGAELFFRPASIAEEDRIIHPANQPILNKNPNNPKKQSVYKYDIIKNKRYTMDQYEFHLPIVINKIPQNVFRLNDRVKDCLKDEENTYVVGIKRGERNLISIVVIDNDDHIVEQYSLNEITSTSNGISMVTDYNRLLTIKEQERLDARQNWTAIENIKELKSGYLSQVINKVCELVFKYDAVIAIEDLSSDFVSGRIKIDKQVYRNFEKALINKLNYLVDKKENVTSVGGALNGIQLTNKFESFSKMKYQNGFIFYVPTYYTSTIDPVTGFAKLHHFKYTNMDDAKKQIMSFDGIFYENESGMFRFDIDYDKFDKDIDYRKHWRLYTNGTRSRFVRKAENNNNNLVVEEVDLKNAFKDLLNEYNIDFSSGDIREKICEQTQKSFYVNLFEVINLMLQMKNVEKDGDGKDYFVSPVKGEKGIFYDSRIYEAQQEASLPKSADLNGAYNIARKANLTIKRIKANLDTKTVVTNKDWLQYAQSEREMQTSNVIRGKRNDSE